MRLAVTLAFVVAVSLVVHGQSAADAQLQGQLKQLFPQAGSFSAREGQPPHFKAFAPGGQTVVGYAFWTTDLQPLERGYDGPIKVLVGLGLDAKITGIIVAEHKEPYGDFSIDRPNFPAQFAGKDIREAFRVGGDIDAVSTATITVSSATRAVRNSARRIARQFLTPPGATR